MHTTPDTLALIGNTPLVRLKGPSEATGCDIFGKCEFANPGASVKDRAALFIVEDAEERGLLAARRDDRRGHRGQYRDRARAGRQCQGLQDDHRHARDAEPREDGHAARAGRRTGAGAGRALSRIPAISCTPRAASPRRRRTRSGPTSSTISPIAARISSAPRRRSGRRWTGGSTASPARRAPAGRSPGSGWGSRRRTRRSASR